MIIERDDDEEEFRLIDPHTDEESEWFEYGCLGFLKVGEHVYVADPSGGGEPEIKSDTVYEITAVSTTVRDAEPEEEEEAGEGEGEPSELEPPE